MPQTFDVAQLLRDVFAPRPGERVTLLVDMPADGSAPQGEWAERWAMAEEWRAAFATLTDPQGQNLRLQVRPVVHYLATGRSNAPLPETGTCAGETVILAEVMRETDIVVALTTFSATAPLVKWSEEFGLRAASMPSVERRMEQTALQADYREVARRCRLLAERLTRATGARLIFSTGDELFLDLRWREGHVDDGYCGPDKPLPRVINLPGGEGYIVPYEGERPGDPSRSCGTLPFPLKDRWLRLTIRENRVVGVRGEGPPVEEWTTFFSADRGRANLAELGLGCNDQAVITGNVLEDEKVGPHIAYGRSDHLGGAVGPAQFDDPAHLLHRDMVFARGCPVETRSLVLKYADGSEEEILRDGAYRVF